MYLGIDLATTNCGLCWMEDDETCTFNTIGITDISSDESILKFAEALSKVVSDQICFVDFHFNECFLPNKKKHIATTFLKVSAFAICKLHEKHQTARMQEVERNDRIFEKNYMDSLVYKNTYKKTADNVIKDTALWRYEIAHAKAKHAKQIIDGTFYASIT